MANSIHWFTYVIAGGARTRCHGRPLARLTLRLISLTALLATLLAMPAVAAQPSAAQQSAAQQTAAAQTKTQPMGVPPADHDIRSQAASAEVVKPDGPCAKVRQRPCTALVLGGGGARGGAHLAVLRQLEAQQIPVDLIVGTSIGAFIGGLYAQGKTPDQIEQLLLQLDWAEGFRDRVERDELPARRKEQRDQYPINLDLGVGPDGLRLPKGVLHGQAMSALIQQAYGLVPELDSFDRLAVPFRAVATDLTNRDTVVLDRGNLLQAVQASMSIPGVVRPMQLQNRLLVDGGVANNLPVSVAQSLGADRVIAVAIDAPLLTDKQLSSAVAITEQLTSFLVAEAVSRQLALLTPQDVLIKPDMAQIGTLDFGKLEQAIAAGQQAAMAAKAQLGAFSEPAVFANWQQQRQQAQPLLQLAVIALENRTGLSDKLLLRRLNLPLHQPLSVSQLQQGIRRIYGLDTLEKVSVTLQPEPEPELQAGATEQQTTGQSSAGTLPRLQRLLIQAEPKSWGPAYLNFRLQLEDDFANTHNYQLAAEYLWTDLSPYGAEWQNEVALGTDKQLSSTLHWPLAYSHFFGTLRAEHNRVIFPLEDKQGLSAGELSQHELELRSGIGYAPADAWQLWGGLLRRDGRFQLPLLLAEQLRYDSLPYLRHGTVWQFSYDTLDSRSFPSRGQRLEVSWESLRDRYLQSEQRSQAYSLHAQAARQWGAHILRARLRFDRVDGADNMIELDQFTLGGLLNLSGYPKNYLFGSEVRFGSLVYQYQWPQSRLSLFRAPFYLGASLERGLVGQSRFSQLRQQHNPDWIWAGSVFAGWDSPFGPLYLGFGQASSDLAERPYRFYLSLGQNFCIRPGVFDVCN